MTTPQQHIHMPAPATALDAGPWLEDGVGKHSRPLAFLPEDQGWVELMRLAPGVRLGLHRHTGEVHAYNLRGSRLLSDGRVIGPGGYVFEPPGNVDWWEATGEEPLVVFVVVKGTVEYLRPDGGIDRVITARTIRRYCEDNGFAAAQG